MSEELRKMIDKVKSFTQFMVENTDDIKRWFGDSKVVDTNGNPLVVYTGTDLTLPNNRPIYLTKDEKIARHFGTPTKCILRITNPFVMDFSNSWQDIAVDELIKKLGGDAVFDLIKAEFGDTWSDLSGYLTDTPYHHEPISIEAVVSYIKNNTNHDGLIFYDIDETTNYVNTDTYVVFDKNQILPINLDTKN